MKDQFDLQTRGKLTIERYFKDVEDWPTSLLIRELETTAYKIARNGDIREANEPFVLVAEFSLTRSQHNRSQDCARSILDVKQKSSGGWNE